MLLAFNDVELQSMTSPRSALLVYKSDRSLSVFLTPFLLVSPLPPPPHPSLSIKKQTTYCLCLVLTEYISTMRFALASIALLAFAHSLPSGVHGAPAVVSDHANLLATRQDPASLVGSP